jgi:hypothetical protein
VGNGAEPNLWPDQPLNWLLSGLRTAWQAGEVRPTACAKAKAKRQRQRPDPFAAISEQLRAWFEVGSKQTGRALLNRLQAEYRASIRPDSYERYGVASRAGGRAGRGRWYLRCCLCPRPPPDCRNRSLTMASLVVSDRRGDRVSRGRLRPRKARCLRHPDVRLRGLTATRGREFGIDAVDARVCHSLAP